MLESFMLETKERQDELEEKLDSLENKRLEDFKNNDFGMVLDYVIDNKQEEKIEYMVNGFINLASPIEMQEDIVLIYYDILEQLNMLDIRVLKAYNTLTRNEGFYEIQEDTEITIEQYKLIQNKLERLGLLETSGQSQFDEMFNNVKHLGEYLSDLDKGRKARLKFKKPKAGSLNSYKLTSLGWSFLRFFTKTED